MGGTNGKHAAVPTVSWIPSASYIDVQIYEHIVGSRFWAIPDVTSLLQTFQFAKIHSHEFLCILKGILNISDSYASLTESDMKLFHTFKSEHTKITKAIELLGKKKKKGGQDWDEDELYCFLGLYHMLQLMPGSPRQWGEKFDFLTILGDFLVATSEIWTSFEGHWGWVRFLDKF